MTERKFKISKPAGMPVTDQELLDDLKSVSISIGKNPIGRKEYEKHGKHSSGTMHRRFGSWNIALEKAGLEIAREVNISDEKLFENILNLWQHLGKQPSKRDLGKLPSKYSERPYSRRFGSWWNALEEFVNFANDSDITPATNTNSRIVVRGPRDPSLRLRWKILQRDRFTCVG